MACRLFGAKPLSEPMLDYCQLLLGTSFGEIWIWILSFACHFRSRKCIWNCRLPNWGHFVQGGMSYKKLYAKSPQWIKTFLTYMCHVTIPAQVIIQLFSKRERQINDSGQTPLKLSQDVAIILQMWRHPWEQWSRLGGRCQHHGYKCCHHRHERQCIGACGGKREVRPDMMDAWVYDWWMDGLLDGWMDGWYVEEISVTEEIQI